MSNQQEGYDIIFAGGGSTACVTAGRLAQADPSLRILILEAGHHTREVPEHIQPGRYMRNLLQHIDAFSEHTARPTEALANRAVVVPSGRAVGGGSSVNFTTYTRAAASDYDDWEFVYGNKGWGSKDLIPLLKKAETYEGETFNDTHGTAGPIKISFAHGNANVGEEFLKVAYAYDTERSVITDMNDFQSANGYAKWARYIDGTSGRRSDTAHHYIYNQAGNRNLTVLDRQRVVRVIIEDGRAVGVEYISDTRRQSVNASIATKTVCATKLVVLAAGAFGSPAILERSGIGTNTVLKENGIAQVVDLPGVGENYMDHNLMIIPYFASDDADTLDIINRGSKEDIERKRISLSGPILETLNPPCAALIKEWTEHGSGLLANNAVDAGIMLRPVGSEDFKEIGPEFEHRWASYFSTKPDKPVMLLGAFAAYTGTHPSAPRRKYFSTEYWTAYPMATGHVHITSGLDPYGKLDLVLGFLEDKSDLGVLRWSYKLSRELARRMRFYRGELDVAHPPFPEESQAACKAANGPVPISAPKIQYTPADDKIIDTFHRTTLETTWHSSGTCAMKPRNQGGVVSEMLDVYGVRNLKVADLSILPSNVGANTYNTTLAIGEKAALIIAEELGIHGTTKAE
ncbi:GMC oxidoreductase [Hypholoma sublateritium FD-334 SS-4]|uniref:pyranose dehydrogenase (acceptor) n=1 Tax=Hypholoma sublateritium (strain FD-334 SS-4) TaxID=945553 RepID=A0A0D2LDG0_HYPSF|nr:GMC oxidoreductase [Hypholoma sublateritium FD-334 SS-4]